MNHGHLVSGVRPTRAWREWMLVVWVMAFGAGLTLTGCGKEESTDAETAVSEADLDVYKEDVAAAKRKAEEIEADKYAKDKFADAVRWLERAEDKGQASHYKRAISYFKDAYSEAEKKLDRVNEVKAYQKEYEEARGKALEAGADKLVKSDFERAVKDFDGALAKLEEGKRLTGAKREMKIARDSMKRVLEKVAGAEKIRSEAIAAKEAMIAMKAKAEEADAANLATSDLEYGKNQESTAERHLADGEFKQALRQFQDAKVTYSYAVQNANRVKLAQESGKPVNPGELADSGYRRPVGGDDSETEAPRVDPIPIPEVGDGGGALDLVSGLQSLYEGSFDFDGEFMTLEYDNDGTSLQKDSVSVGGEIGKHILFTGIQGVGVEDYTIAGNTSGTVLIKAGFTESIRIRMDVTFQMFVPAPTRFWEMMVNANGSGSDYYGIQIGNKGLLAVTYKDNNPVSGDQSAIKEQRADANKWLDRKEGHTVDVSIQPDEKGRRIMSVSFNGQEVIRRNAKAHKGGYVGLRWKDAKFFVTNIKVKGKLDEEWARKELSQKAEESSGSDGGGALDDF